MGSVVPFLIEGVNPQNALQAIDECHRGGANNESNWRGILDYFAPAVQLGLTATAATILGVSSDGTP